MAVRREQVDLSNVSFQAGFTGRFLTLNCVPVVAGDSIAGHISGVTRISPMRRNVVLDPQVDIVSFYVPHRHIYPNWDEFIAAGPGGGVSLSSVSYADVGLQQKNTNNAFIDLYERPWWIPWGKQYAPGATTIPLWMYQPMVNFWNRYGRLPKIGLAEADNAAVKSDYTVGFPSARMPHIWSRLHESTSTDDEVAAATTVRLSDIAKQATLFKRDQQDEWAVNYPDDILRGRFGGRMNTDADPRPEIVAHTTQRLSGFNMYGTAGDSEKQVIGRYEGMVEHGWRRRYFPEHGSLWTTILMRFPEVAVQEQHYLTTRSSPTYKEFACDPDVIDSELPVETNAADYFTGASPSDWSGFCPYGEWYRSQANLVSPLWTGSQDEAAGIGYPVRPYYPKDLEGASMQSTTTETDNSNRFMSDQVFYGTTELKEFNVTTKNDVTAWRCAPDAWSSIYSASDIDD